MGRPRVVTDEQVLAATERAISRVGPGALTLTDVAEEAGIAAPTLIKRFGSKRGLLLAFAARGEAGVHEVFVRARAGDRSPLDALVGGLEMLTAPVRTPAAMANHLAFLQLDLADEEFRAHAVAMSRRMRSAIEELLGDAVAAGELARGTDTRALARRVHTMYNGALVTWAIEARGTVEAAVREAVDSLLRT